MYLHVVLPTPPFPPTNTHFNDFWSIIFFNDGSKGSNSAIIQELLGISRAVLVKNAMQCVK